MDLQSSTSKQLLLCVACCSLLVYGIFTAATAYGFWGNYLVSAIVSVPGALGVAWVARLQASQHGWKRLPAWLVLLVSLVVLTAVLLGLGGVVCDDSGFSCGG